MRITFHLPLVALLLAFGAPATVQAQNAADFQLFLKDIVETCIRAPENVTDTLQSHGFQEGQPVPGSEYRNYRATFDQRQVEMTPPEKKRAVWPLCQITISPQFTREEAAAAIDPVFAPIPVAPGSQTLPTYGGAWCRGDANYIAYSLGPPRSSIGTLLIQPDRLC